MKIIITESQYNFIKRRMDWIEPIIRREITDQEPCYYKLRFGMEEGLKIYLTTVVEGSINFILQDFPDFFEMSSEEEGRRSKMIENEIMGIFGDEIKNHFINVDCKFKKDLYF